MVKYVFKRILWFIPIMIGVSFLVFALMKASPVSPVDLMLGAEATPDQIAAMEHDLGLDKPFLEQYVRYIANVFRGDMGTSYSDMMPVLEKITNAFPFSFRVSIISISIASVFGIFFGVTAATHKGSWIDGLCMMISQFFISMPGFWFALIFVSFFAVQLGWLPVFGVDTWQGYILPCVSSALAGMSQIARQTRSSMLEVIRQDYITTEKAKGQRNAIIIYRYALKNALLPIITVIGNSVGRTVGAGLISETIYSIPGMGGTLMKAINARDFPVVEGCVIVLSLYAGICVLITDIVYAFVDPRLRSQYQSPAKKKRGNANADT